MDSSEPLRQKATQILVRARRNLSFQLWWLKLRLFLRGYELIDYSTSPYEIDWSKTDDSFLFEEEYTFVGTEYGDIPMTRRRTLGYHWQLSQGHGEYREHIKMTVNKDGEPQLTVLYSNLRFPANRDGWKSLVTYLKSKKYI